MTMNDVMLQAEARSTENKKTPLIEIGDTVDVSVKITEGDKTRTQVFTGVVIAMKHSGLRATFTVRRLVDGEGVERTFPVHSPLVEKVVVKRHGVVRRAKLYYLRDRVGKATRLRERISKRKPEQDAAAEEGKKKRKKKRGAKAKAERRAAAEAAGNLKKPKKRKRGKKKKEGANA